MIMAVNTKQNSRPQTRLIFACSGAADVGQIADLAARRLMQQGVGRMFCLAGVGGRVPAILETTRGAKAILAIDGCPQNCACKTLEQAGFAGFHHLQLQDLGLTKGNHPPTAERVEIVCQRAADLLA
jgi:uncharacterized metal-binding protein